MNGSLAVFMAAICNMVVGQALATALGEDQYTFFVAGILTGGIWSLKMFGKMNDFMFWTVVFMAGNALDGVWWFALLGIIIAYILIETGVIQVKITKED